MAKEVEVMVMVSHLQLDEGLYRRGETIFLSPEKIMSLGNSVAVLVKPEEKPKKVAKTEPEEEVVTRYEEETVEPPKKTKPRKR